jgi:hypothetical protein
LAAVQHALVSQHGASARQHSAPSAQQSSALAAQQASAVWQQLPPAAFATVALAPSAQQADCALQQQSSAEQHSSPPTQHSAFAAQQVAAQSPHKSAQLAPLAAGSVAAVPLNTATPPKMTATAANANNERNIFKSPSIERWNKRVEKQKTILMPVPKHPPRSTVQNMKRFAIGARFHH